MPAVTQRPSPKPAVKPAPRPAVAPKPRVAPKVAPKAPAVAVRPTIRPTAAKAIEKARDPNAKLTLATELSVPVTSLEECHWLIYGNVKIGKTTLLSEFERPYFLFFEQGGKFIEVLRSNLHNWKQFIEPGGIRDQLLKSDHQTIVIDTADKAYDDCFDFVCKRERMTHPNDKPWGEGWRAISKEFRDAWESLADAGKCLVFISHAKDKEFQTRAASNEYTYSKIVPSMSNSCRDFVEAFVDVFAFYGMFDGNRYLCIRQTDEYEAGTRLKKNFRTADGKRKVLAIPMFDDNNPDFDEEDAYRNLVRAFQNKQAHPFQPEGPLRMANVAAKKKPALKR